MSASVHFAGSSRTSREVREVPISDICSAAKLLCRQKRHRSKAAVDFNLPKEFVDALQRFREERNKFTHDIWEDEEGFLRFGSRLEKRTQEVRKFCYTARVFSDLFGELNLKGHIHRVNASFANFE